MDHTPADYAIQCALNQNWQEAIKLNQQIISHNPEDVEALNRLAYAYLKSGNISSAKSTYKKVLKVDKYNPIAIKNLKWLDNLNKKDIRCDPSISSTPNIFLEEPGKTRIVNLVDLAPAKTLCNLITAQKVFLHPKKFSIEVRNGNNIYIGALPDDLSHRLLKLLKSGNVYEAYIKNIAKNSLSIFIRETHRGKKYHQIPSFSIFASSLKNTIMKSEDEESVPKKIKLESLDESF